MLSLKLISYVFLIKITVRYNVIPYMQSMQTNSVECILSASISPLMARQLHVYCFCFGEIYEGAQLYETSCGARKTRKIQKVYAGFLANHTSLFCFLFTFITTNIDQVFLFLCDCKRQTKRVLMQLVL